MMECVLPKKRVLSHLPSGELGLGYCVHFLLILVRRLCFKEQTTVVFWIVHGNDTVTSLFTGPTFGIGRLKFNNRHVVKFDCTLEKKVDVYQVMTESQIFDSLWSSQENEETMDYEDGAGKTRSERVQAMPLPDLRPKGNFESSQRRFSFLTGGQHWAEKGKNDAPAMLFDSDNDSATNPSKLYHAMEKKRIATQVGLKREGTQDAAENERFEERGDLYNGYNPVQNRTPKILTATRRGTQEIHTTGKEHFSGLTVSAPKGIVQEPLKEGSTDLGEEFRGFTDVEQREMTGIFSMDGEDDVTRQMMHKVGSRKKALNGELSNVQKKGEVRRVQTERLFSIAEQHAAPMGDRELSRWDSQNMEASRLVKRSHMFQTPATHGEHVISKYDSQQASTHLRTNRFNDMAAVMAAKYLPETQRQFATRDGEKVPMVFSAAKQGSLQEPQKFGTGTPRKPQKEERVAMPSQAGDRSRDSRIDYSHTSARIVWDVNDTATRALAADESRSLRPEDLRRRSIPMANRVAEEVYAPVGEYKTPFKQDARDVSDYMDRGMGVGVMSSIRGLASKLFKSDRPNPTTDPRMTVQGPTQWTGHASRARDGNDQGHILQRKAPLATGVTKDAVKGQLQLSTGRETPTRDVIASYGHRLPDRPSIQNRGYRQ